MIALRLICVFLLLGLTLPASAQNEWSPDWSPDETASGAVTYVHNSGNAYIVDWVDTVSGNTDVDGLVSTLAKDLIMCPDFTDVSLPRIIDGRIHEFRRQGPEVQCSIFAGRMQNRTSVIYAIEAKNIGVGSRALAITLIEKKLGLRFEVANVAKPTSPVPTKTPSRFAGIWRADWVESRNPAKGSVTLLALNETLIFTPGGYFFHGIPESGAIDDMAAKHWINQQSASAGTYSVRDDTITLTAGNGAVQSINAQQDGDDWIINYLDQKLVKKVALPDGHTLEGHYYADRPAANIQGKPFSDFFFFANGRFSALEGSLSNAANSPAGNGQYEVKASALHLHFDDGESLIKPAYMERTNGPLWIDGNIMWLAGGQTDEGL